MFTSHLGEIAALATAFCWTFTAMSFESAGKKVGSLAVNYIRLVIAMILLTIFNWFTRGMPLPADASSFTWSWLLISGLIGFTIGDLFLFKAFVDIGARISMLIMSLVPPITALIGWLFLGENLTLFEIFAMVVTITGIATVVLQRDVTNHRVQFSHPVKGILFAFGGAVGQSVGLIFSKHGMGDYSAFAATQIRIIAGIVGFSILFTLMKRWQKIIAALRNKAAMRRISLGAFFGPFLGVSFSLLAVQNTLAGIASTIMAIVPVLIIPPAVLIFKEKVTIKEIVGALIAVAGVVFFFLH